MAENDLPDGALPPEALPDRDLRRLSVRLRREPAESRLDRFLAQHWPQHSRSTYQKLIRDGRVTVGGEPVTKPSADIHRGDWVEVTLHKREPLGIVAEPIPIDVIYEDADLIAVAKVPGIIVHPARGNPHGTLVNAVAHHAGSLWRVISRVSGSRSGTGISSRCVFQRRERGERREQQEAENDISNVGLKNRLFFLCDLCALCVEMAL